MRVLIALPNYAIGGWSSHALNLSKAFRSRGHETIALTERAVGGLRSTFAASFNHLAVIPRWLESSDVYIRRLCDAITTCSPDAMICSHVPYVQATLPLLDPRIVRVSVVHSIVDDEIRIGTANAEFLNRTIAVSDNVLKRATALGRNAKMTVIPVGVELPSQAERRKPPRGEPIRLIYVGRLSQEKNVDALAPVTDELNAKKIGFELLIVGDGRLRRRVEREFSRREYHTQVKLTGQLAPAEVRAEIGRRHVQLMPSSYEGTPHALLEGMSLGLVPIATNIRGSTDRIIRHGHSGVLCGLPPDPVEYAGWISRLASDPHLFESMSTQAAAAVKGFNLDLVAEKYLQLIMQERRRRRLDSSRSQLTIPQELQGFPNTMRWAVSSKSRIISGCFQRDSLEPPARAA